MIFKNVIVFRYPLMICSPLLAKLYFPRHWRPVFKNWEKRGRLCFLSWSTIMAQEEDIPRVHPLRVEFKYTVRGQGIITCNRDWWERVWGRSNLPQKISTALSEPKFEPPPPAPNKNNPGSAPDWMMVSFKMVLISFAVLSHQIRWFCFFESCLWPLLAVNKLIDS